MTYLPGQPVVPCAVCGTSINRRGKSGGGHRKYCSKECTRVGTNREVVRRRGGPYDLRTDGICPRCGINPRPPHGSRAGGLRSWCRPCEAEQKREYNKSPAGKAAVRRYQESHFAYVNPPVSTCQWCAAPISHRGAKGQGTRKYCDVVCRRSSTNLRDRIRRGKKLS